MAKFTKILYFLGKRFSEMKEFTEDSIDLVIKELQNENSKKDAFEIDIVYKEKVWREFYERGVVRNTIDIVIVIFILSIVIIMCGRMCIRINKNAIRIFKYFTNKYYNKETPRDKRE